MPEPIVVPREAHPISRRDIDPDALRVLYRLQQHDHVAYLVGGSVRDLLLGRRPKDFDIGTDAHPHQIKRLFRNCWIIGRRFRLAHIKFGLKTIEVATFRKNLADLPAGPPEAPIPGTADEESVLVATAAPAFAPDGASAGKPAGSAHESADFAPDGASAGKPAGSAHESAAFFAGPATAAHVEAARAAGADMSPVAAKAAGAHVSAVAGRAAGADLSNVAARAAGADLSAVAARTAGADPSAVAARAAGADLSAVAAKAAGADSSAVAAKAAGADLSAVAARAAKAEIVHRDNTYGTTEEDAFRRDFTVNALFYDVATRSIIDYVGGLSDLERRVIRSIGDPRVRFVEDPVRMLRAAVLGARLGFDLDELVVEAIAELRHLITKASPARLLEEYFKILRSGSAEASFRALARVRLLELMTPELKSPPEALWDSLARLDCYRLQFPSAPPELTTPVLMGALLQPIGALNRRLPDRGAAAPDHHDHQERVSFGALPVARKDLDRLRQILQIVPRLTDPQLPPRVMRGLPHRPSFGDAVTWFEVFGDDPTAVEPWKALRAANPPRPPQPHGRPRPHGAHGAHGHPGAAHDRAAAGPPTPPEGADSQPRRRRRRRRRRGRRGPGPADAT